MEIPFQVEYRLDKTIIIPDLSYSQILGASFCRTMGILPNLKMNSLENNLVKLTTSFQAMVDTLGCSFLVEHIIKINSNSIKQMYYLVSPVSQQYINNRSEKILLEGILQEHIVLDPYQSFNQKERSYRFWVDYRKLNAVTQIRKRFISRPYVTRHINLEMQYISLVKLL